MKGVLLQAMVALCALCAGCGVTALVTDLSRNTTEVSKVKLSPSRGKLTILHGGATRTVRLKDVEKIVVYPHGTRNAGGKLYYQAEVILDDGTRIGFSDPSAGKPADAFVCIDGSLRGRAEGGTYQITFDKVSQIEIRE
ncbi:MAG: hypothetical protein GF418_16810 [Chitinivibrionales bacterium]|nr:hypothetical protein [Chitinivibrionales bacterium]MBD3397282.1 hypothetical protein [Chitinivibrionales bacterium]